MDEVVDEEVKEVVDDVMAEDKSAEDKMPEDVQIAVDLQIAVESSRWPNRAAGEIADREKETDGV
jgi:division protein CdvB (Snf7/Vps24/ESCRT-III family)